MILADIQTSIFLGVMFLGLIVYGAGACMFLLLRAVGRTLHKSYEEGGGNRQLAKNVATRGSGMLLKRLIMKLILKR